MLQRIQSIWLLLAAVFAAITFRFPFYTGIPVVTVSKTVVPPELNATSTVWITIFTVLSGIIAFIAIFLFGNRKLQLRITYLGIFFTVLLLIVYFMQLKNYSSGTFALSCILYFAILAFYIFAARGIWKDQKLIKSMDRLR